MVVEAQSAPRLRGPRLQDADTVQVDATERVFMGKHIGETATAEVWPGLLRPTLRAHREAQPNTGAGCASSPTSVLLALREGLRIDGDFVQLDFAGPLCQRGRRPRHSTHCGRAFSALSDTDGDIQ